MTSAEKIMPLLRGFSVELTPSDKKSIEVALGQLPKATKVFIASLPTGRLDDVVEAAVRLKRGGLIPVPHLAARNIASETQFDNFVARLSAEAGVDQVLVLGGDRDRPLGTYDEGYKLLTSGVLQQYGIRKVHLPCYPEGHPRISNEALLKARAEKLAVCELDGFAVEFVSQFCFEAAPIMQMVRDIRQQAIGKPLRIGLAGPTSASVLLKYAMVCGVGASIRVLRERQSLAKNMMSGNTETLLAELASGQSNERSLHIDGIHFFTFGSLARTVEMLDRLLREQSIETLAVDNRARDAVEPYCTDYAIVR